MIALAEDTTDEAEIAPQPNSAEQIARLAAAFGLLLLLTAVWAPLLDLAALSSAKEVRILPRLSVFFGALLASLLLAGARWRARETVPAMLLFACASFALKNSMTAAGGVPSSALNSVLVTSQALAILFAGLSLGGMMQTSGALLQFLACAIAGDIWLNSLSIPDGAGSSFALLRLSWPPVQGFLATAPGFGEVLVCGALAGCARRLGLPLISIVLGAFAGYCAASFLALPPWPAWPTLSVLLITSGTLIGCWPDLNLNLRDLVRALLLGISLMVVLAGFSAIQQKFTAPPKPEPELFRYRSFT
jgi:hypothetical protein